jgi:hypothetical protein
MLSEPAVLKDLWKRRDAQNQEAGRDLTLDPYTHRRRVVKYVPIV